MGSTLAGEDLGRARRARRRGRARPSLHRPAPGPRGDEPAGVRRAAAGRAAGAAAGSDDRHRGPQRPRPDRLGLADRRPGAVATQVETLRKNCAEFGVRLYPMGDAEQGIVHVIGPQLGLTQPGMTIVCGDCHTSTHGAFGALAFGIGTSEVEHVLATQTLPQRGRRLMAVTRRGPPARGRHRQGHHPRASSARIGTGGGQGYVIEYRGRPSAACRWKAG